ncbi:uncharacterized protein MKS88_000350 [Plasmodium brasilianum]|uniref:uncharacterized protein n=1 Tax=Plasmodium brasilianum TaxID=5824 RepID=UPI00350E59CB|nr:hypothetical protein MKS88_000350 [Plasmodium brasilianum]
MKKKIKLSSFIKIATFIFLTWICPSNSKVSTICKYLDEKNIIDEKLSTRTYRLLTKHKKQKYPNMLRKKDDIPNNGEYKKKHISKKETISNGKNKLPKECISNSLGSYKQEGKIKSSEYNKVNTYPGKRMLDKIYYKNVLRYSTNTDFKFIKRCIKRKRKAFYALYVFNLVVGVAFAMLIYFLYDILNNTTTRDLLKYFGSLYILWVIVLVRLFYILRKIDKHKKLLHLKSKMNYTV